MILIDVPVGSLELIVSDDQSNLTIEIKGTVLGTPEDVKLNLPVADVINAILAGTTNPFAKWLLGLLLKLL